MKESYRQSLNNIVNYSSMVWDNDELIELKKHKFEIFNDLMMEDTNPWFVRQELEKYIIDYYVSKIKYETMFSQGRVCTVSILGGYRCQSFLTYDHYVRSYSGVVKIIDQLGKIIEAYEFHTINPDHHEVLERNLIPLIEKTVSSIINKIYDYAIPGIYK